MKKGKNLARDVEFLYEIGTLRNVERNWRQVLGPGMATVLEHTVRTTFVALFLARMEGEKDEEKIIKMTLAHDLTEARTGDTNYVHAVYTKRDETRAGKDLFAGTSLVDFDGSILHEFEERKSKASQIVKDADNLEVELELMELEARGSKTATKMKQNRHRFLLKKLYTTSAKKLFYAIQKSEPESWHLSANKWVKLKNAGR